jgi:hypothetical protein
MPVSPAAGLSGGQIACIKERYAAKDTRNRGKKMPFINMRGGVFAS